LEDLLATMETTKSATYDSKDDPHGVERLKLIEAEAAEALHSLEKEFESRKNELEKWKRKEEDKIKKIRKVKKRTLRTTLDQERENAEPETQQNEDQQQSSSEQSLEDSTTQNEAESPRPAASEQPSNSSRGSQSQERDLEWAAAVARPCRSNPEYGPPLDKSGRPVRPTPAPMPRQVRSPSPPLTPASTKHRYKSPPPAPTNRMKRYKADYVDHPAEVLCAIESIPIYNQLLQNFFIYVPTTAVPVKLHHFEHFENQMKPFGPKKVRADDKGWFVDFGSKEKGEKAARACFDYLEGRKFMGHEFKMQLVGKGLTEIVSTLPEVCT
jgi:flagellar biosynthesis GTPase FlhF